MEWEAIKEIIVKFLSEHMDRELKTPDRRLKELEKIEKLLSDEHILEPSKLLFVDKEELISSLGIKSGAAKSIINNIYNILNGKSLKVK